MAIFATPGSDAPVPEAVFTIFPYRHDSAWVFDDDRVGLVKEPFVSGIDLMIDRMTVGIPNAAAGFRLDFSTQPFDGWQKSLTWRRADPVEGNWYRADDDGSEGWLCPALFWYFPSAPRKIYVAASAE